METTVLLMDLQKKKHHRFRDIGIVSESGAVGVLAGLVFLAKWAIWGQQEIAGDGAAYLLMAKGGVVDPPQSFHILTPWLAAIISPSNPSNGFALIAGLSFLGTAICIGLLVRRVVPDVSSSERFLAVALFMATGTGAMMFRFYCFTDALSYFLLAVACVAILSNSDRLLMVVTLIGIFNRETALFSMPVWFIYNAGRGTWVSLIRRGVFVLGPAAIGYYILHHTSLIFGYEAPHLNYLMPENILLLWRISISWLGNDNIYLGLAICVFLAYGPVWFLSGCGVFSFYNVRQKDARRAFLSLWGLAIPVLATLMIVDWRRGFQPLFPVMVISGILGMRLWVSGPKRAGWWVIGFSTIVAAAICSESWWYPPMRIPVSIAAAVWVIGICIGSYLERGEKQDVAEIETEQTSAVGYLPQECAERRRIWVILPTFNEAENLPLLLERLSKLHIDLQILVVDDNSPDGTAQLAAGLAKERTNLGLISREAKGGLGSAYVAGFEFALKQGADLIVTMDSDLSHQPEDLPHLIESIGKAGVVVGSRYVSGGQIVNWPKRRVFLSATANRFVRILFRMPIKDCTSGFRVYDRNTARTIVDRLPRSPGYSFQVETLYIAKSNGSVVREVPIRFVERANGESKMGMREIVLGAMILFWLRFGSPNSIAPIASNGEESSRTLFPAKGTEV